MKQEVVETQLVIQTRGKKRRLAEAAAGGDKLAPNGVVRLEDILQRLPRKRRTRVAFTQPGDARSGSGGSIEHHGSGARSEDERKNGSAAKEAGPPVTCTVKQESDATEVAGERQHDRPGERTEGRRPAGWLVPFKRRSGERTGTFPYSGAVEDKDASGGAAGAGEHGAKRFRAEVLHLGGTRGEPEAKEQRSAGPCVSIVAEESKAAGQPPSSVPDCQVGALGASACSADASATLITCRAATRPSEQRVAELVSTPPFNGKSTPGAAACRLSALSCTPCERAASVCPKTPSASRAADSPPPASEPYTTGTPDASQGSPPDVQPPAADVMPPCDGATPLVSWPATPEKVRPDRPQMSPPTGGAAARSGRGLEAVRDGGPRERTPGGEATPETSAASPCKCSTCCCSEGGTVFVTLLVPCRTAMTGRFPLNGTYFQTNELFADHATSQRPLAAPAADFAGLPRCTVLFGTGATNMFKAASLEAVREVFQHGYICVRGFDVNRRTPKALSTRLHAGASVKKK